MKYPVLRVLVEKEGDTWVATCLEFNVVALGATQEEACKNIEEAIDGYLQTVFDTDDRSSIPHLLNRPAPFRKRGQYWLGKMKHNLNKWNTFILYPKSFGRVHA